jgi:hypothetical protein
MSGSSHRSNLPDCQRVAKEDFAAALHPAWNSLIIIKMQLKYFLICTFVTGRRGKGR